ncbi:DNA glycosylase [[Eubacterium] rectale]|uniref:DNA glycosylase n=1 Tax=Agathobacter rectalis TaxID=39491 RepID=A0AAP3Q1Z9_9FIRM|nr:MULTISPECIES: DNA glycosylase [Lachnospiraceae]MDB2030288.1 DNA glycosylase [[Clostridium] symbiosum]MDB8013982.1 DNA glycosylase [Agathobacter rectalis]MDB8017272.1 DNA glycosylase [Agathobacter rectalis]MDB8020331.1 DNA glycosylase [Agathobacter rectalis]MDB8027979.1 DNA glycosylase [Agathobacter rectalis]
MILKEIQNFDLNQIANSGQCFRWKRTRENAYLVIHKDKVVTISQLGGGASAWIVAKRILQIPGNSILTFPKIMEKS